MEYLDPSYQAYPDELAQVIPHYGEPHNHHLQHSYTMANQATNMIALVDQHHQHHHLHNRQAGKANETKPRLGKEEVEILEQEFKANPKPTTQTKKHFAEEMGVELARINNWFQNRRAKRKQEKKQEAYEADQAQDVCSEPASPGPFYGSSSYLAETSNLISAQDAFPVMSGPAPPVAPYIPQYTDPSSASMESLQRTMVVAQAAAASQQHNFVSQFDEEPAPLTDFTGSMIHVTSNDDRARFPAGGDDAQALLEESSELSSFNPPYQHALYSPPVQPVVEARHLPQQTPTIFDEYSAASSECDTKGRHALAAFSSQLLSVQPHRELLTEHQDLIKDSGSSGQGNVSASIGFSFDAAESERSTSPPASTLVFKSPPPPTDLASRRKKAVKPAALIADNLRGRPSLGPRAASHADGFRRTSDSPMPSPMRRVMSVGGNRSVVSGRVGKSGIESAQRSPININGFSDARAFREHNYYNTARYSPSLTGGSSFNNHLAPPTPMSPMEMTLAMRDGSSATASPVDNGMGFMFNSRVPGCFTSVEDQNLASPPETPQSFMGIHPVGGDAPAAVDCGDKQWHYEVPDEALYTPSQDSFPAELQVPQPAYLSSFGQPATPAFGQFNPNFTFGNASPQFKMPSTANQFSSHDSSEYTFPDSQYLGEMASASPMTPQKTFQFSNATAADFDYR